MNQIKWNAAWGYRSRLRFPALFPESRSVFKPERFTVFPRRCAPRGWQSPRRPGRGSYHQRRWSATRSSLLKPGLEGAGERCRCRRALRRVDDRTKMPGPICEHGGRALRWKRVRLGINLLLVVLDWKMAFATVMDLCTRRGAVDACNGVGDLQWQSGVCSCDRFEHPLWCGGCLLWHRRFAVAEWRCGAVDAFLRHLRFAATECRCGAVDVLWHRRFAAAEWRL